MAERPRELDQRFQVGGVNFIHCVSKKVPTFKLSVTLSNLNRLSKCLQRWKAYEICYKNHAHYPPHLHYLGKFNIQIFCMHSANMEETANRLHFGGL